MGSSVTQKPGANMNHLLFTETQGDLFDYVSENTDKVIYVPHVTNDKHAWGAGFVLPLAKYYPKAKSSYLDDSRLRLGRVQYVNCVNHNAVDTTVRNVIVANMCAQTLGGKRPLYYNKLSQCMEDVAKVILNESSVNSGIEIVCPRFGSALAGGNWEFIKELIMDCWVKRGINVKVFYL